jgi:hypothetical protein
VRGLVDKEHRKHADSRAKDIARECATATATSAAVSRSVQAVQSTSMVAVIIPDDHHHNMLTAFLDRPFGRSVTGQHWATGRSKRRQAVTTYSAYRPLPKRSRCRTCIEFA